MRYVARHSIDCDLQWGQAHLAVKRRHVDELWRGSANWRTTAGYRSLSWLDRDVTHALASRPTGYQWRTPRPESGHLHPLNHTLGLRPRYAQRASVCTKAKPRDRGSPTATRFTATVTARAKWWGAPRRAVLQRFTWTTGVAEAAQRIAPVGTYIVATELLGETRIRSILGQRRLQRRELGTDYSAARRTTMLFGGRVSYLGLDLLTGRVRRARMVRVFRNSRTRRSSTRANWWTSR